MTNTQRTLIDLLLVMVGLCIGLILLGNYFAIIIVGFIGLDLFLIWTLSNKDQ